MAQERLYIEGVYIPLQESLNPAITKSITDIEQPDKRKATASKSVKIPFSKEANAVFSHIFEINAVDLTFNPNAKASCRYEADSEEIILGYLKLNSIEVSDTVDGWYNCQMCGTTADFFATIKDGYLTDLYESTASFEGLDIYDHQLTKEIQQLSWATQIIENSVLVAFAYGKGYVYPLIDYGFSSDQTNFIYTQIPCAIYEKEYLTRLIAWAGFTVQAGGWIATDDVINHLIIPASPECYQLDADDIEDREFAANTPEMDSTSSTTSANLPIGSYCADDLLKFTNDSTGGMFDPGLNYDPATGEFTAQNAGVYDLNTLIEVNATFTPGTGTAVKTTCDIHGFIMMFLNGVEIDAIPFYITSDDSSFTVGARSTSSTPTYPDTDYMVGKAWGKINPSAPVARGVNPPDRYQLTINGIPLQAGDVITVKYKAGIFATSLTSIIYTPSSFLFVDALSNNYTGDATLTISVGSFYNKAVNTTMTEGNTLQMLNVIPPNVKMVDYFMSLVKHFNLWIDINPENPKELIIKTRDSYLGGTILNIHEKIDRSPDKPIEYVPMTSLGIRRYKFSWKPDKDYWNERYSENWQGEVYGQRQVDVENEFSGAEKVTEIIFSPTCMVAKPNTDLVLPTIYQLNDTGQPVRTKHNIRRLYYAGLKPCFNTWNHINYVSVFAIPNPTTYATYPYAGHFDDAFAPTLDINFGLVKEVFYVDNITPIVPTDNNAVNKYWGKYLREISDPDSRIVNANVRMRPFDFVNFTFDKLYYWDWAYFRLQQIIDYNAVGEETVRNVFLKINNASAFIASTHTATGSPLTITPDQSGGNVNMAEVTPAKGTRSNDQPNNNNHSGKSVTVRGENNYVNATAKNGEIYGDYNAVRGGTKNIKIHGSNNIIEAGVENVTLINTNGLTVTESDVTYINGVKGTSTGSYTPVASSATNLDATPTMGPAIFSRIGDNVIVSGYFDADPTTTLVATDFEMSLPIASALSALEDVSGTANSGDAPGESIQIFAGIANGTAYFSWVAQDVTSNRWSYILQYRIL